MTKFKTIIIDDVQQNIDEIKRIVEQNERFEIVATANNGNTGLREISAHKPDLVLLDIEMPVMGGFDLVVALKDYPALNPTIVFITVYDEFAIQAIRHSAFDYILKTSMEEYLPQALNKFALENADRNLVLGNQIETLMNSLEANKQIVIHSLVSDVFVRPAEIICIRTNKEGASIIYLQDGDRINTTQGLTNIEVMLPGKDFFRLSRRHLINIKQIREIKKENGIAGRKFVYLKSLTDSDRLLIPYRKNKLLTEFIDANLSRFSSS